MSEFGVTATARWLRGDGLPFALAVSLAAGAGVLLGAEAVSTSSVIIGICAVAAVVALSLGRRKHRTLLHPCLILGGGLCVYGILGFALYPLVYRNGPTPLVSTALDFRQSTLVLFLVLGLVLLSVSVLAPTGRSRGAAWSALRIDLGTQSPTVRRVLFGFLIAVAVSLVLGSNLPAVWHRFEYRGYIGGFPEAYRFGEGLRIPALLCGWMFVLSPGVTKLQKSWALVAIAVIVAMDFATASRGLAVGPILFVFAYLLTRDRTDKRALIIVIAGILAFFAVALALFLRTQPEQGISGYGSAIAANPIQATTSQSPSVIANALTGFPLAGYVANVANNATLSALLQSINPVPRSSLGHDPTAQLRVVSYMPYSSIGLLGAVGILIGVIYFAILAAMLSWLWVVGQADESRASIATPTLVGVAIVLGLMSVQYQLRTTTRIATVAAVGVPILLILSSRWRQSEGRGKNYRWAKP